MLATTHVTTGAAMSFAFSPTPTGAIAAFVAGTASHLILDSVPHWGGVSEEAFIKVARIDGIALLIFSGFFLLLVVDSLTFGRAMTTAAAMFGALLFDLDKPVRHFFNVELWPSKLAWFLSHIQTEHHKLWPVDFTTGLISALIALYFTSLLG
jgi:hypothetical protein